MLLAQGLYWRATSARGADSLVLELRKAALPEELRELRELRIEVPLEKWNSVLKHVHSDRKLLGGFMLDFARHKDRVSAAMASDRLLAELRRIVLDATAGAVEEGILTVAPAGTAAD